MTTVLLWDIDGTLLTTGRAGIFAWEGALEEITGQPVDLSRLDSAGLTDVEIAVSLLEAHGVDPAAGRALAALRAYELRLPASLHRRVGAVLPNVRPILEALRERDDVRSLLLTGNTKAGAAAKLKHYGLAEFFDGGAFSDDTVDRTAIARNAFTMAQSLVAELRADQTYVIGDTPHDIRCGHAIGARVIAVATSVYTSEALQAHAPWWTVAELPDPRSFLARLELEPTR